MKEITDALLRKADNHLHEGVNFALTWHISKERLFW